MCFSKWFLVFPIFLMRWTSDLLSFFEFKVPNYLPSISAAIGGNMPEMFIWRVAIALHCFPRILLLPSAIHKHYTNTQSGRIYHLTTWWFKPLNFLNYILEIIENGALLSMTYISSVENHGEPWKFQFSLKSGIGLPWLLCLSLSYWPRTLSAHYLGTSSQSMS